MYIQPFLIDDSPIFIYEKRKIGYFLRFGRELPTFIMSIPLKKNEKNGPLHPLPIPRSSPREFLLVYKNMAFVVFFILLIHTNKIVTVRPLIIAQIPHDYSI